MIETIYVEEAIKNHSRTKFILNKFKKSRIISINNYGEIFNKRNQNFRIQKVNPSLILAYKKDNFVLPAPKGFGIGSSKNFYFSQGLNFFRLIIDMSLDTICCLDSCSLVLHLQL